MQRIFVVYNPRSSNFCHVKTAVLDKLPGLNGYIIGKYAVKKTDFDDNVAKLSALIKDEDLVIAAGGDATSAIAVNAAMKSGKSATLAALPFGNFNDLSRTLGFSTLEDILTNLHHTKNFYPLDIVIDGTLWRHASCYTTIGMMAESTKIFDENKIRQKLRKGHHFPWCSYFYLAGWYFKNRHKKHFLENFTFNNESIQKASDYIAVNGISVARVMRGREDYTKSKTFHSTTARLTGLWRLFCFMMKSMFGNIPGNSTTNDIIKFAVPTSVIIQAEGESEEFTATTIEIHKSATPVKVVAR
jgi:diacylglycerol kinase family enzyme